MPGIDAVSFEQALVTQYCAGATIGWHRVAYVLSGAARRLEHGIPAVA